ncbi:hypothetical protein BDI4_100050 [Burkholderia diffusa]|uniref:hypothetical protein n=1 Tax=Burkholderia diffusa TaxID=488732 RepID=UPI001CB6234E|nr:hypothetical protein [Burkholderia diffusa]CAG9241110.1 hypothetical protein BDI4_100050 [Burkholderia diffusa]
MTNPEADAPAGRTRRRLTGDRNQCPTCGEFFNSTHAFDAHRTGPFGGANGKPAHRRCLSTDEMRAKGMTVNKAGFWMTAKRPDGRTFDTANADSRSRRDA